VACRKVGREANLFFASINPAVIATDLRKGLFEPSEIGHGSEPGLSLMMHLVPGMVREEVGEIRKKADWQGVEILGPLEGKIGPTRANMNFTVEEVSPTSSWGDHGKANAERGKILFERMLDFVSAFTEHYRKMDTNWTAPAPRSVPMRTAD
jgi:creatinine amidohydrolase/Fe(II)-dependent formamide hydrolase-like protein